MRAPRPIPVCSSLCPHPSCEKSYYSQLLAIAEKTRPVKVC